MKKILKILFVLYCAALVYILFLHNGLRLGLNTYGITRFSKEHFVMCNFVPFKTIGTYFARLKEHTINTDIVLLNILGNLALFVPMGFFLRLFGRKETGKFWHALCIIAVIVISVELIQFVTFTGSLDIDDVILNVTGGALGYAVGSILIDLCKKKDK